MGDAITKGRFTAGFQGPVVVFVIGMRINRVLRVDKWLPVAKAMGPMLSELSAAPDSGFLGAEPMLRNWRTIAVMQYWRDFDSLEAYARNRDQRHWPAWTAFNKSVGSSGTVGIFHETYSVTPGGYETIYANMLLFGLGRIAGVVPATGSRQEARSRMRSDHARPIDDVAE